MRRLSLFVVVVTLLVGRFGQADAICVGTTPNGQSETIATALASSDAVVVGTVESTSNMNRYAVVRVDEIWKGKVASQMIQVKGGAAPSGGKFMTVGEHDRSYLAGTRYLLDLSGSGSTFEDNTCTRTTEWTNSLLSFRPVDARSTTDLPEHATSNSGVWLATALVAVAVMAVAIVIRRRMRT